MPYFAGEGVRAGAGVEVGASSLRTSPAGVRSASIGVVSGVGGAGFGAALESACGLSRAFDPHPAPREAVASRITRANVSARFIRSPLQSRADSITTIFVAIA